jgi:2-polyprenyl-6-methoxyphenol hydroxylase-like FAD-dependent oxidoreductase
MAPEATKHVPDVQLTRHFNNTMKPTIVFSIATVGLCLNNNGTFVSSFSPPRTTTTTTLARRTTSSSSLLRASTAATTTTTASTEPQEAATTASTLSQTAKSRTQRIMEKASSSSSSQTGGAGGSSSFEAFRRTQQNWERLKNTEELKDYDPKWLGNTSNKNRPPQFVTTDGASGNPECWAALREVASNDARPLDYDVTICGGTLGIFFALALQAKGHSVAVLEAGKLQGREQEWNISMKELEELVELGVLTQDDLDAIVTTEFPGCRSGFKNKEVTPLEGGYLENNIGYETVTPDVLNLGVAPKILLERVSKRFLENGGTILEQTRLQGVAVSESVGAALDLGEKDEPITSRLVLDCMGNASPISRQQRYGMKPDGVCAVVGSCAAGFDKESNLIGDIIYTNSEIQDKGENGKLQYFWEAFPVGIGRNGMEPGTSDVKTTYMFTYMDADKKRPSLETLMEDYWDLLPVYQPSIRDPEQDLDVKRVLFAFFPTYRDSPLQPQWSRVLAVGDASGIQSPLSFGGFGALTRHLERISGAISEALDSDCLHKEDLKEINAYTPNLSAAWMFQKAMSVRMGQHVDPKFINRLLANNFQIMDDMGMRTIKPFLQDVIRFDGLFGSLARSFASDPLFMPQIVAHVGVPALADWLGHVSMMALYSVLHAAATPVISPFVDKMENPRERFAWRRRMESWKFGSGSDYILPEKD